MGLLCQLIQLYVLVVFARIILSFFQVPRDHPVGRVETALAAVVDPLLRPIRRVIPPARFGGMGIDFSPLVLVVVLSLVASGLCRLA